ncbi:efflux RND transporter periplasmic adaptor subunit [Marinobacterium sediminicola]|uniref:Membrane fusion protein, multidrug efflux system n=1 Tax=Marinobacterium sediminicola TaxID=518898 RepID=A0ABY1RW61_9GAMM|nr:efflux RND transporter periplasmic adaptor subunit [Marinobacterium sediminicola]ULG70521.1 efflux RND transporter periplasmic adaptor subunit [Marinobacterium sediminicola]SMR69108.1 membrane fusion protein, multidrug efflux system [Marinobacterium sediminicola]
MRKTLVAICLTSLLNSPHTWAEDGKPSGLPAEVMRVQPTLLEQSLTAVGVLQANESVMIRPEQSGRISEILFEEGQQVSEDSPMFKLDSALYDAAFAQAQARARLSQLEYERAASLLQKRVGSRTEHDAKLAQLRVDEAEVALARTRLEKMTVRAPFTGTVGLRLVSPGDFVTTGQDLVELTDTSSLKVEFSIPERHLQQLHVGQPINLSVDALGDSAFAGEIYAISPSANPNSHNISVRARVPNSEGLMRPGLFARITIITSRDEQALVVPEQTLILQGNQTLIMQVNDANQVEMVPVTTGSRRYGEVQILSGLKPGAVVVTAGHIKLQPGMPVTPIFAQPGSSEGKGS